MTAKVTVRKNGAGMRELEDDLALGLYGLALVAEAEAKREAPVRGGYRSFRPGTSPIGGTLRRSVHSVTYGTRSQKIGESNELGKPLPFADYVPIPGAFVAYMGTNSGYGAFVELGTSKMAARPFIVPGLEAAMQDAAAIIKRAVAAVRATKQ